MMNDNHISFDPFTGDVVDVEIVPMNVAQMWRIYVRWYHYHRLQGKVAFRPFLATVQETSLMDDAVVVLSHNTWLAVEVDGHMHS